MEDTNAKHKVKPDDVDVRGKPGEEAPFAWLARKALERIRDFQDMKHSTVTLAIYGALTELASMSGSERFTANQRSIMKLAGIGSDNTLRKHLGDLCKMRLLKIEEGYYNGLIAPCTYTILSTAECTAATAERTASRLRNKEKKANKETHASHVTQSGDWRSFFCEKELRIIDLYHDICVPRGWRPINADSAELHRALKVLVDASDDPAADDAMFREAADERDAGSEYTTRLGNKLIRILRRHFPSNEQFFADYPAAEGAANLTTTTKKTKETQHL